MAMVRHVLLTLLAVVLILPTGFVLSPAAVADDGGPEANSGAELIPDGWPSLSGTYMWKGRVTYYTMEGEKIATASEGRLTFVCQSNNLIEGYWQATDYTPLAPDGASSALEGLVGQSSALEKAPQASCSHNGVVGSRLKNDKGKFKNKPWLEIYFESIYGYYIITARIKLDSTTGTVKSIKGHIQGRSWAGPLEGKFTATPQ